MVNERGEPAKDKADAIGIIDGRTPHELIEGVQILVVARSEIVAQQSNDLIEGEWTDRNMLLVEGLPRQVAGGEITMRVITRVADLLDGIQQDMDLSHIIGVTDRRRQNHLRDGL